MQTYRQAFTDRTECARGRHGILDTVNRIFALKGGITMNSNTPKYKRVLLKLSGEALASDGSILDYGFIKRVGENIRSCLDEGVQVSIVVGAGNIWRGRMGADTIGPVRITWVCLLPR